MTSLIASSTVPSISSIATSRYVLAMTLSPLRRQLCYRDLTRCESGRELHSVDFISNQSLCRDDRRSTLVLDQEHQEFRGLCAACVAVNDMNIVGAFIEALSWCQCYLLPTLQLHHNRALKHVKKRLCIVLVVSF